MSGLSDSSLITVTDQRTSDFNFIGLALGNLQNAKTNSVSSLQLDKNTENNNGNIIYLKVLIPSWKVLGPT